MGTNPSPMGIRRLVRGTIEWPRIEGVIREIAERYDREEVRVEFIDADNWLSTPCVVDDKWFVKVTTDQNSLVHALFTSVRNLGAFSSGTEGFFEHFAGPNEMAEHELEATKKMREIGLNVPAPIEAFEYDDLGVLVMEYLPEFETFEADFEIGRARTRTGTVRVHSPKCTNTTSHTATCGGERPRC